MTKCRLSLNGWLMWAFIGKLEEVKGVPHVCAVPPRQAELCSGVSMIWCRWADFATWANQANEEANQWSHYQEPLRCRRFLSITGWTPVIPLPLSNSALLAFATVPRLHYISSTARSSRKDEKLMHFSLLLLASSLFIWISTRIEVRRAGLWNHHLLLRSSTRVKVGNWVFSECLPRDCSSSSSRWSCWYTESTSSSRWMKTIHPFLHDIKHDDYITKQLCLRVGTTLVPPGILLVPEFVYVKCSLSW